MQKHKVGMEKRGLKDYLKNNLLSFSVFIVLMISGIVMAGNIIVNEGNLEIEGNLILGDRKYLSSDAGVIGNVNNFAYPNLNFTLSASTTSIIDCTLLTNSSSVATGITLNVSTTGSPTTVRTSYSSPSSASAMEFFSGSNVDSNNFADLGNTIPFSPARVITYIVTSGSSSVWSLRYTTETTLSSVQILMGSYCEVRRLA
mgnify:CR=1 FL=1